MKKLIKSSIVLFFVLFALMNFKLALNGSGSPDLKISNLIALASMDSEDGDPCVTMPDTQCFYTGDPFGYCIYCAGCIPVEGHVPMTIVGNCGR